MLGMDWHNYHRIFTALAFVYGCCIREHYLIQLVKFVCYLAIIELDRKLLVNIIELYNPAYIAVKTSLS